MQVNEFNEGEEVTFLLEDCGLEVLGKVVTKVGENSYAVDIGEPFPPCVIVKTNELRKVKHEMQAE